MDSFNWPVILVFAAGCLAGLMMFSRLLSWLLHHHHEGTMALLTGMLAGSLYMLWPWQVASVTTLGGYSVRNYQLVLPASYQSATGLEFSAVICTISFTLAVLMVLLLEYGADSLEHSRDKGPQA